MDEREGGSHGENGGNGMDRGDGGNGGNGRLRGMDITEGIDIAGGWRGKMLID